MDDLSTVVFQALLWKTVVFIYPWCYLVL